LGLLLAAGGTAAVLARGAHSGQDLNTLLLLLAFVGLGLLVRGELWRPRLDRRVVLGASGALLVLAVAVPPTESNDVWAYSMYGRMVSAHHDSPYRHVAADYPTDPWSHRVDKIWRKTPSVYGPAFVAVAAGGTALAGGSFLAGRLFFQVLAGLCIAVALLVVFRRTRGAAALACLGLNPVIV